MQLVELLQMILRDGILGFLVGILIGLTGIGGGAVIQPILIIGLGLSPVASVGTGLLFAMVTKIGGAVTHIRMRNIRPRRTLFFFVRQCAKRADRSIRCKPVNITIQRDNC